MPKNVPEIRVSAADRSRRERAANDSHSECAISDAVTDCETLEANYSKRSNAVQGKNEDRDEDVILTDVDGSSDDERETVVRYPLDCINSILDLGMSCEEVSNSQGPNKRQKSITCSLERSKPRTLNADKYDEGGTDVEGVYMSEDEEPYRIDSDNDIQDFEPTAFVSISDKVVTGTILSPRVTPEPCVGRKKKSSSLSAPVPISSVLTDTEMLISDAESNSTRSRKMTKVKPFKTMFDGFATDTEDSDSSADHSSKAIYKPNRKIKCSRSFDNIRNTSSSKSNMLAPIRKSEDGVLTDTENIYLDDGVTRGATKSFQTRPTVIRMNKPVQSPENASTIKYRHNAVKSKPQSAPQVIINSPKKYQEKTPKHTGFSLNLPTKDDTGNATDVEAFGSDSDEQPDTIRPVAYLPNPKCELIIDNESYKGKMSFILPITESQKGKSLRVDDLDCGYSDVEDLPGFEAEEYFRYPTPDLPRTEHSTVQNKEVVIDPSKLKAEADTREPLTDTEDLNLTQKPMSGNRLKVKLSNQRKGRDINECHTDVEDLDGSDTESRQIIVHGKASEDIDQVELTDVGEQSSDDSDDDAAFRFTAATPDFELNNTYTNARESMSPFSFDVRRKLSEAIPQIRTISPSPIPRATSTEDFLAFQDEREQSNWASDVGQIEPHSSQVSIKHTNKFNIDDAEKLHIKGYVNHPEPTTDVEELTILEALEELRQKKRRLQKNKERSEWSSVNICYNNRPKEPSCKPNTRIYKSSRRHDDKPRGADKSKEAVESSWLSKREGESVDGGIRLNAGEGLKSPYDNINDIYYKEMADETVYPPQLGYAEFESPDVLGSTSSLAQEHGTDTFSELLFSSSNSESEEPDENFPVSREYETYGILYDMSSHINKVPEMFTRRTEAARVSAAARPDSPQELESRLKYYHNLCNRSLSPEVQGVTLAERAELKELEESISQMLIDIRREESLFYSEKTEETDTIKRRPKPKKVVQDEMYKKINEDGETALKEIESHISKLLQDVEKEEREIMGSLHRDFKKSTEKLEESASSPWDMINATTNPEGAAEVSYARFRDSSCTPSPVESSSTSEDEYDVVPKVELNIGNRLGRSTIDISVKHSPASKRKSTRMSASKRSLNRSLPSLKSSSMSLVWRDHSSSECLLEGPTIWQSSSVEYIPPPQRIEPGSGYCVWSYPSEEEYGQDQVREEVKKTTIPEKKSPPKEQKPKEKGKREDGKKEPIKKNEKPSLDRKDCTKRISPGKTPEPSKKVSPDKALSSKNVSPDKAPEPSKKVSPAKTDENPLERRDSKKTPSPEKRVSIVREKTVITTVKSIEETFVAPTEKITIKPQKSQEKTNEKLAEVDSSKLKSTEKTMMESTKSETIEKEKVVLEKGKGKQKKGKNGESGVTKEDPIKLEEKMSKQVEPAKSTVTDKKTSILGKTFETIKKPFQDKGAPKDEKGKGKGKRKSFESAKSPSLDDGSVEVQEQLSEVNDQKLESTELQTTVSKKRDSELKADVSKTFITAESSKDLEETAVGKSTVKESVTITSKVSGDKGKSDRQQDDEGKGKGKGKKVPEPPKVLPLSRTTSQEQEKFVKDAEAAKKPQVEESPEDKRKGTTKDGNGKGKVKGKEPVKQQSAERVVVEPLIEKAVQDIAVIAVGSVEKVTEDKAKKDGKGSPKGDKTKGKGKGKDRLGSAKTPSVEESDVRMTTVEPLIEKTTQDLAVIAVGSVEKVMENKTKKNERGSPKDDKGKEKVKDKSGPEKNPSLEEFDKLQKSSDRMTVVEPLIEKAIQDVAVIAVGSVDKVIDDKPNKGKKGSPKDDKNKGKGNGKSGPVKSPSVDKPDKPRKPGDRTSVVDPVVEKTTQDIAVIAVGSVGEVMEDKAKKDGKGIPKDDKNKGKGKGKSELAKTPSIEKSDKPQNPADRVTVVEPLIEKTMQDIAVIAVGSVDKVIDDKAKKEEKGSPKDDKNKGKGKGKDKTGLSKTPSLEESDRPQKSDTTIVGKAVELIKKPFQDQTKLVDDTNAAQKPGKGKKQKSVESRKSPSLDKDDGVKANVDTSQPKSETKVDEITVQLKKTDKEEETPIVKTGRGKGKGNQSLVESIKSPSPEKDKIVQIERTSVERTTEPKSPEPTIKEDKKKGKGKQMGSPKKPSLKKEESFQHVSTLEPSLIEKTLETIKRPFQGRKDDKAEAEGKREKGKSKQKSIDSRQSSTEQEPKEETRMTTETVRLIKKRSQDKSGQVIEEQAINLVTDPLGDKTHFLKSDEARPSIEQSSRTTALIKELSLDKSGQQIEESAIDLVSKPFEQMESQTVSAGEKIAATTLFLSKELSSETRMTGKVNDDKETDSVTEPLQDVQGHSREPSEKESTRTSTLTNEVLIDESGKKSIQLVSKTVEQKDNVKFPSKEIITSSVVTLARDWSLEEGDKTIAVKEIDLVSKPLQEILGTHKEGIAKVEPLITELSHEKSGFIIEERPIDLVSQPFQNILKTSLMDPKTSKDTKVLSKTSDETSTVTAPLIKELSHVKSGFIVEERPIDLASQPFLGVLGTPSIDPKLSVDTNILSKTQSDETSKVSTAPLIKELSHEKSGFIIEERPIDLVSQPFQNILETSLMDPKNSKDTKVLSKTQSDETSTVTAPLIKELSHEKSGFIIEERPIDLVSQPFQNILETSLMDPQTSKDTKVLSKTQSDETYTVTAPLIEELSHAKSGFIIEERPIDLASQPFQEILGSSSIDPKLSVDTKMLSKTHSDEISTVTAPLIKELSHEKSGFIIEERPIDLVSQPFQDILGTSLTSTPIPSADSKVLSKTQREETATGPLIKELSHEKSGFIIEERAIDLVSQPFQGILESQKSTEMPPSGSKGTKSANKVSDERSHDTGRLIEGKAVDKETKLLHDTRKLPPSTLEGSTRAVSLMKELSQDKSGQVIEEGGIDLVAQPFFGSIGRKEEGTKTKKKEPKSKTGDSKKGVESPAKKNDFEHIQKTIDDAKVQFDQFVGIVSDKAAKSTSGKASEKDSSSSTSVTTPTIRPFGVMEGNILRPDEQEVEIPVEKEEDLLTVQKTIRRGLQNLPSENTGTFDVKTITTITKPFEQEVGALSSRTEKFIGEVDQDVKMVTETVTKSVGGGVTLIEKRIESELKPVKDASATAVEKTVVTIQENLSKTEETFPGKIGTMDVTSITTVTKPIEKGADNISIQAEKIVDLIGKDLTKAKESLTKTVDGGVTVVEKTIESRVTPAKDTSVSFVEQTIVTVKEPLDVAFKGLGKMAQESTKGAVDKSKLFTKGEVKDIGKTIQAIGQEAVGKVTHMMKTQESENQSDLESSESFPPELRAQSVKIATFETVETIPPTGTGENGKTTVRSEVTVTGSSTDEIGRIIKEMESQLLTSKFGMDEVVDDGSEVESEDFTRESRTMPTTPMPARKLFGDVDAILDSEGVSKPYVTTPTLSRRVIGVGGSQRLTQDERPVVRVITEYVRDLSESEPEEDTYTVLEPEVKERRKFKIRFSPDMYGSEDKEDVEELRSDSEIVGEALNKSDSVKSEKNIKRIERKFERMTSQTKEADPTMSEVTDGEFQRMVSQLSLEEMDQALHQWDADGLTPSEIDSKDLTLSSDDTTSPLQQGLTDIFRPKLSSILPTSIYVEKTGAEVGSSGLTENSKMKLSLVKDSVPQIFQSIETDSQSKEGSHTLEPEETGESPPIPSPRTPLKPTDSQDMTQDQTKTHDIDIDESKNYATRKMFWEQMSSGSTEAPPTVEDSIAKTTQEPPVPKPRARSSISQSIDLSDEKKAVSHSEASVDQEVSEIGESDGVLHGVTTTDNVARDSTTERGISLDADTNSEMEFIKSHDIEEMSYDNDAFDDESAKDFSFPEPKQRKNKYERSVSLPGDTTIDISNNVRSKKRIFEAQIKKEMVVEQLMSQMEEEGSPERKAFEMTTEPTDQAAMLNRQIHSEIVSHELEEQIESNLLENKDLVQNKSEIEKQNDVKQKAIVDASPMKIEDDASESDKTNDSSELPSIYETKISSSVAEVLHYKNDAISKPSDSLEVHFDKSESEETEKVKEIEDDFRVMQENHESRPLTGSDQAKVSSITSSQGESEDTFSESDVTPEDARFKEQLDIHVWGPSDRDVKLGVDEFDSQKKTRSVHTPEEHIPDTVWEVPVQESTEPLEVETVGQLPTAVASWQESESLTESEARKIAEIFVGEIESELINTEAMALDTSSNEKDGSKIKPPEKTPTTLKSDNMLKLIRTDTTTSSMEITDEDLRSSGMTDNSPLESQVGLGLHMSGQHDVFGEDSGDDVDAQELDRDTIGKEVVDKTLAEVKQSLEAVKKELIEEKKKKRDSITKESPSEFEFKALVLEKTFSESIQEHHQEEATTTESKSLLKSSDEYFSSRIEKSDVSQIEKTYSSFEQTSTSFGSESKTTVQEITSEDLAKYQEPINQTTYEEISKKEEIKFEEHETSLVDTNTVYSTSVAHDIVKDTLVEPKEIKTPGSTTGSEVSIKSTKSQDTVIERINQDIEKQGSSAVSSGDVERSDVVIFNEDKKDEPICQTKISFGVTEISPRLDLDLLSDQPVEPEERKSPLDDVFSNSSSSDYKGGSNEASTLDKPNIIIRKHKKSTFGNKDPKSDGEPYSSSGSHYESFEQTSDSIKSPGSRPLSSDIEGLVAASAGITTGSSEYETAVSHEISGQSTTITSREYQTAVSSLSSRDSMKSLDSESSGNLASIEVSSEASETLVPSAMELEKDSEEPVIKQQIRPPITVDNQVKMQSFSESIEQSVSFDISGEDISEDDNENPVQPDQEQALRMKRSHEMTFQPEPRPIVIEGESIQVQDEKLASSLDDMSSLVSSATDTGANRTVIELSKTESERMDGSATSDQFSLTVSGTSDLMSLSESREFEESTVLSRTETIATQSPPFQQSAGGVESVTITTSSIVEQGIQSVCTQLTSKVEIRDVSHSNGPTQVEYNAEYDEGDHEVKKRGHRRNGSTSFRPSMIPVFQGRDTTKKSEDIIEDSAESDKYTQPLTVKEGTQEEKKDVDETEKLEEEFYKTEADQAMNRDLREGRFSIADTSYGEGAKSFDSSLGTKSRLHSAAFSDDHPDSEIAQLLNQCSSDIPSEDPIERPKTPEPVEECELRDDTPELSSEAQASVTELEMEYSGAFSRSAEYAAHVSPIREKGLPAHESWEHLYEDEQTMDDSMIHSPDPLHLGFEHSASEKHELETHESTSKEKPLDRSKYVSSPVPDITVTQHMHPTPQDSFEKIDMDSETQLEISKQTTTIDTSDVKDSSEKVDTPKGISDELDRRDSASDSPTSDSFELLEKPDIADEFVIIEEVGREASEQDTEGKSIKIDMKKVTSRAGSSSAPTVVSPPTTVTKMTQVKYFSSGATEEDIPFDFDSSSPAKSTKSEKQSSQEGSPPSVEEPDFKPDLEASKKWMEMQFQGTEPVAQIYGYDDQYDRGPLEDIKEEDINDLEGSSRIGSMGSQVSQSIGSFGSVKESLSSTPDYDVLAGRKFFTRSGEHDDVSMSSLQEFERLEHLIALESSKHKSLGSQDSLTSSSNNSRKHGSRSGGDDISLASLKEFEGLESACIAAERIEKKAKLEEETLLSEIEEGHESQASESESCATISIGGVQRGESDEDDYERRMFEIDEIIRQAQTNVEQFMDSKNREAIEGGLKSETLGRADSLEEISKVPELDLDQPLYSVSYSSGKSYIQQWEDLGDDLITSTDSLELKTQKSKTSIIDPFTTSTDSLDVKISQDVMSVSTDSIEASQKVKKKDIMTDSIEVGEKTSMLTSVDSLEGKVTQANSIDEDELHALGTYDQSSSSGKEGDLSSSGKDDSAEGAVGMNRMPPPRAEYLLGSTDSLEPTSSTATHATYHYETDSVMSSSFTSGDSTTMVDDNDEEGAARASMWFDEGKPYVTEVIEPIIGDDEFSHVIHRKVEMPPEIHKVSFKGLEAEHALREYIENFDPGEDCTETREVDEHGNVHVKRVIQKRVIVRPEELGGDTTDLSGPDLEKYLQTLTQSQMETEPLIDTVHSSSESHSTVTTTLRTTTTLSQGDSIKTEQEVKQTVETHRRGSRPPLKYDISVDEDPEFDPTEHDWRFNLHTHIEHDEESQEGAYGFSESKPKMDPTTASWDCQDGTWSRIWSSVQRDSGIVKPGCNFRVMDCPVHSKQP